MQTATGSTLTVALPFTVEFDIVRNTLSSANVCQIRIYNLSMVHRNQLRFNAENYGEFRGVILQAGYGTNLSTIFQGNVSQAWSQRDGTNFITQIECYDGGFAFVNSTVNMTFPAGTPRAAVIKGVAGTLQNTTTGAIGNIPGTLPRGNSYSGNSANILRELSGGSFFIDGGNVNVLATNEYLARISGITQVDASSGLLGTPQLEQTTVRFEMVFEPKLQVAQKIRLNSRTEPYFNGDYKTIGVKHRGVISEAVCGSVITTGEFFFTKLLSPVAG